ncbi:hypothetical protein AB4Y85_09740 [Microvirga sp. 2YAF29]|uniref:hypothetical protein n=1 Tax=Microvirga sp. 2YAF29 TaxID=3233031 RepID=UPI003F9773C0
MIFNDEHSHISSGRNGYQVYDPGALPQLQSLLAILADIDVDHGNNLRLIENKRMDDASKDRMIADLWQKHRKRRAPYVHEIDSLRKRMIAAFR